MRHRLWFWPVTLAALSSAGLVAGLVADGWGDVSAWVGLGMPAVVAVAVMRRIV
jgi:hypothetical protein